MDNIRRERFIKIGEKRVNKLLEDFRLLGNCANRANYEYTQEEIDHIFSALEQAFVETKKKFYGDGKREVFKL